MSKLNDIFANHYRAIAEACKSSSIVLDAKYQDAKDAMVEAARCLHECADRLEKSE